MILVKLSFAEIFLKERKGKAKKGKEITPHISYNEQHGSIAVQELGGYQVAISKG